ncbi:MAG: hypothetical protein ACYC35_02080 [Pirellulales bacterium]
MLSRALAVHDGLWNAGRVPALARADQPISAAQIAVLMAAGACAAVATAFGNWHVMIPGHAIVRAVFPLTLGLALVPRRGAASIMGADALLTALFLNGCGLAQMGAGALTSLVLTGPCLDAALAGARAGWRLYLGCAAAGVAANMAALAFRAVPKYLELDPRGRPFAAWFSQAIATYVVCGAVAGLLSAAVWFRWSARSDGGGGRQGTP